MKPKTGTDFVRAARQRRAERASRPMASPGYARSVRKARENAKRWGLLVVKGAR